MLIVNQKIYRILKKSAIGKLFVYILSFLMGLLVIVIKEYMKVIIHKPFSSPFCGVIL